MTKPSKAPPSVLQSMTKADLGKLNRELNDLTDAADDAGTAVASFYKNKVKKRGINTQAFNLARKINALDNSAKQQSFLRDFDRLRELFGWDAQKNLFDADKTAPQKKAEQAEVKLIAAKPADKPVSRAKLAAEKAAIGKANAPKATKKANGNGHKKAETKPSRVARKPATRAALFDEDAAGPDGPLN